MGSSSSARRGAFARAQPEVKIDLEEHYQSPSEHTADLVVHVVGLTLAAVGGIVLAILSAFYAGFGAIFATAIYALCLIAMLTCSTVYNLTRPCAARCITTRGSVPIGP